MNYLTEEQCEKLNRILEAFDNNNALAGEKVLKIEPDEKKANGLIDILQRKGFVNRVDAEEQDLPAFMFLNPSAVAFLDSGGFVAEHKRELFKRAMNGPNQINIHSVGNSGIINAGHGNTINNNVSFYKGNIESLKEELARNDVSHEDIGEIAEIVQSEMPVERSFGLRVNKWIRKMLDKSLDGVWQVGIGTAGGLLTEIIKKYYGL
ncbi:hypothetical protein M1D52_07295 [Olivibacter sp. SA151]|uniref:hypothetical protein n=1 Tax=Olivibacter jilunii TaxID=985016 RepID=UPI003F1817FA